MNRNHTPTPWRVSPADPYVIEHASEGLRPQTVARTGAASANTKTTMRHLDDAAYIVRTVNAHDKLLAALKRWERFMRDNYKPEEISFWDETVQAIAKAEGK